MRNDDPEMTIARLSVLTPAEQAVLDQALTGVPAREIAERLSLSEATVRSHLSSIYVKLGVSGRVALLAHFRGSETSLPVAQETVAPLPRGVVLVGWSWGLLAVLEGGYALYLLSGAFANGGSQQTWLLGFGFAILAALVARLAREVLNRPSRRVLFVSLAAAGGHVLFAIRGLFLSGPAWPFLVLGAAAFAIGLTSLRVLRAYPDR